MRPLRFLGLMGLGRLGLGLAGLAGCGGPVVLQVEPLAPPQQVLSAPPQTPEERDGAVPPLRGVPPKRALVPANLVPPAPPADPEPGW